MPFDMNRTWSQAVGLVKSNFQLLAVLAGVFVLLPTLAVYLAFPDLAQVSDSAVQPDLARAELWSYLGRFSLVILVLLILELVGQVSMMALVGRDRPTVGEAIGRGITSLPTTIGTVLLIALLVLLGGVVIGVVLGILGALLSAIAGKAALAMVSVLIYVVFMVACFYAWARLCMVLPVIALERMRSPWKVFTRSWRMTRAAAWRIMGFFLLLGIAYFVVSLVLFFVLSAVGLVSSGVPAGRDVLGFSIVSGLVGAVVTMLVTTILVSIHQQLSGADQADAEFDA